MSSDATRVIAVVSRHWLVGAIPSNGIRIQDVLNKESTEFVRLTDVQVCREADRRWCLTTLPEAMAPKRNIELMILPEDSHEAPVKRWNNFAVKATVNVFAIVSGYCVQGELQLPPSTIDRLHALTNQLGSFFPVTDAAVIGPGTTRTSAPVVFVNKRFLSCLHVGDPANVESGPAELESSLHGGA